MVQLFPSDLWTLHHLWSPYRLDDLRLSQSQSNLIIVDLPAINHLDIKSSFKRIGKCVYVYLVILSALAFDQ